jgi:hypothetical protein
MAARRDNRTMAGGARHILIAPLVPSPSAALAAAQAGKGGERALRVPCRSRTSSSKAW